MKRERLVIVIIVMVFLLLISGCSKRTVIKQEVKRDSYLTNTYKVSTCLWVKRWDGWPITIEESEYAFEVAPNDVAKVKKQQYEKIYPIYLKLQEILRAE